MGLGLDLGLPTKMALLALEGHLEYSEVQQFQKSALVTPRNRLWLYPYFL